MARYRRNLIADGTFFFTVKLADPKSRLLVEHIDLLRAAYIDVQKQYPFETVAVCVLPNHIHAIWTLPPDDADYSLRWRLIKTKFSAHFPRAENLSASKQRRNERGIWQRRFYEHTVRDETDLQRCADYIHFNPVKNGLCDNVGDWAFSSFHRYVRDGWLPLDWGGTKETAVMSFGESIRYKKLPTAGSINFKTDGYCVCATHACRHLIGGLPF